MFKHYLCCVAFIRTVAQQLKSNLVRTALAGLLCITIVCIGVGCGNGDVVTPTETETETVQITEVTETVETVEVTDRYVGDSIIFELFGTVHEGRVVEGVSEDEVRVRMADGSEEVITVNQIAGTVIADHPDLGTEVVMLSEQEGERNLRGRIVRGYDNGVRKIEFLAVTLVDGTFEKLDVPRIRFVHEDTDFGDGGYLTLEEFRRLIAN